MRWIWPTCVLDAQGKTAEAAQARAAFDKAWARAGVKLTNSRSPAWSSGFFRLGRTHKRRAASPSWTTAHPNI